MTPGPWLRLTAIVAAAGCGAAVVSGALELGAAHRGLTAVALPPLSAPPPRLGRASAAAAPSLAALVRSSRPRSRSRGRPTCAGGPLASPGAVAAAWCFRGRARGERIRRDYVT
jgi:hypothetical protein